MLTTLITIWILHVAALATPGANVLLVSQLAASDRAQSAVFAALGVTLGALVWASSAVLGVHAIFQAFPGLRLALQIAGGVYLLVVASRLWRSGAHRKQCIGVPPRRISPWIFDQHHQSKVRAVLRQRVCSLVSCSTQPAPANGGCGHDCDQRTELAYLAGLPVLACAGAIGLLARARPGQPHGGRSGWRFGLGAFGGDLARCQSVASCLRY